MTMSKENVVSLDFIKLFFHLNPLNLQTVPIDFRRAAEVTIPDPEDVDGTKYISIPHVMEDGSFNCITVDGYQQHRFIYNDGRYFHHTVSHSNGSYDYTKFDLYEEHGVELLKTHIDEFYAVVEELRGIYVADAKAKMKALGWEEVLLCSDTFPLRLIAEPEQLENAEQEYCMRARPEFGGHTASKGSTPLAVWYKLTPTGAFDHVSLSDEGHVFQDRKLVTVTELCDGVRGGLFPTSRRYNRFDYFYEIQMKEQEIMSQLVTQ